MRAHEGLFGNDTATGSEVMARAHMATTLQWTGEFIYGKERIAATIEGLGEVVIHRAKGGLAVDINGKRAWSALATDLRGAQMWIQADIRKWEYINTFKLNA